MSTLIAIRGAKTYDLSDILDFAHTGDDGWGMAPLHRLTQRGPMQHGVTDIGYRLDPRILNLKIVALATDMVDYYALRAKLLEIFKPGLDAIGIRRVLPDGSLRQADCHYLDGLNFAVEAEGQTLAQESVIQLQAPDPTIYDPVAQAFTFGTGGGAGTFAVPTPIPSAVGASTLDETLAIAYAGSWETFPVIRITGPITNCIITNNASGDVLDFTGKTIAAGDYYEIDCGFAKKTVVNASGVDKQADLTDLSDLATFSILPDPYALGGANSIRATGTAINSATRVDLTFFPRYIGN